jgi:hypothetical protein
MAMILPLQDSVGDEIMALLFSSEIKFVIILLRKSYEYTFIRLSDKKNKK